MDPIAFMLVVGGSVLAGLYHVVTKKAQAGEWKNRSSAMVALVQGGSAILLLASSFANGGPAIKSGFLVPLLITGALNIGIMFGKMRALALEDASLVTPIYSTIPAVVVLTSMVILGETPTTLGWVGIGVLTLGTYMLNIQDVRKKLAEKIGVREGEIQKPFARLRREAAIWFAPFSALGRSAGVRWAFVAVAGATVSLNFDGLVARRADIGFGFGCVFGITAIGNLVVALARREFHGVAASDAFRRAAFPAILFAVYNFTINHAFRLSIVPYVGTLKRIEIPSAIILAYFLLGERKSFRDRLAGGLLMAIGAVLIALG